ncbi:heme peroxidase [Mycena floridula]|nr:heme peroxidase [Mycena floridula]
MDELEHLLVDTAGFNDGRFRSAITPCTNYISSPNQLLGRETAAQWIRVAFHDFATANVHLGTGGIDASIGFETLRPENSGAAMNDSLRFFAPFVNAHVSMADLIALGVVMSIGGCSDPSVHIPLRTGRVDATEGGDFGVPEPETGIEETLEQFSQAGFGPSDAIGLTACGHSMGAVHNGGFPQVVNSSAVTPNNTGGGVHFDATPDVFDIDVVNEYLSGTGQRGGPLVTTPNVTVRSDLRIYTSDNNATMRRLASSAKFVSTCVNLFSRMLDTVPATTTLSDAIVPNAVKPVNVSLNLDSTGNVIFSGYVRLLPSKFRANPSVTISWFSRNDTGASSSTKAEFTDTGSGIFGSTAYYHFSAALDPSVGISKFFIKVDGVVQSDAKAQDAAFLMPLTLGNDGTVVLTAAVLTAVSPTNVTASISVPSPQLGTIAPRIQVTAVELSPSSTSGLYTLYSVSTQLDLSGVVNAAQTSVDLIVQTGDGIWKDEFRKVSTL